MKKIILLIFIFLNNLNIFAQTPIPPLGEIFRDDVIPRVDILIPVNSLNQILDLNNAQSDTEYEADFIFNNSNIIDTVMNIGFRIRGNTSRTAAKKSFKISFNTFESGRKFYDLEKMNLNGEHNDPSIIRSILGWNMLRKMKIPAPRANHVELYINGNYYGLYINTEHIDEEFLDLRFDNNDGNLYKCSWGSDFRYISNNADGYKFGSDGKRVYDLKTNTTEDDYSDFLEFINILNNEALTNLPCELEKVFNVDAYLKVMAFDVLTANWDGPIWNKNNCYLYKNTATGQFEYIPYDLDNTYGVSWFQLIDWGVRDIYQWSENNRPIYQRILAVQEYKDRFSFYMNQIIQNYWTNSVQFTEIDQIKSMIDQSVSNDIYRTYDYGFTLQNYHDSYTQPIGWHLSYGIKDYIIARENSALSQLVLNDIRPVISNLKTNISIDNQTINFNISIFDNQPNPIVKGWISEENGAYNSVDLYDDGNHNDGQANDGIFGGTYQISINSGAIKYYITALDNQNQGSRFPRCTDIELNYNPNLPNLVINELMASNATALTDEMGEFEDWIELYNGDNISIDLNGFYLSDNPNNPNKWPLPNLTLEPDSYLLIWADEDSGDKHANFKLKKSGETLGIYSNESNGFAPLDVVTFPAQTTDISYGRIPNGIGNFVMLGDISPEENNEETPIIYDQIFLFPNPFSNIVNIYHSNNKPTIKIFNALGQQVFEDSEINTYYKWFGVNQRGVLLPTGVYFISFFEVDENGNLKLFDTQQMFLIRY